VQLGRRPEDLDEDRRAQVRRELRAP
jgi:hypothetical protein